MSFESPGWLAALLIIPVFWRISLKGVHPVSQRQNRFARLVRSISVACLVLAAAGTSVKLPDPSLSTIFVVDVSDSVSAASRESAETFIQTALGSKPEESAAGVVVFGREPRVESSLGRDTKLVTIATKPDTSRTDLSRALRLAQALVPDGHRGRIVLMSDGRQNSGDAMLEARRSARLRIPIDTVPISTTSGSDVAVTRLVLPARARVGDSFELQASVFAREPVTARLTMRRGGEVIDARDVTLAAGDQTISIPQMAGSSGPVTYSAQVTAAKDSSPRNDRASGLMIVEGPARVMVLEGTPGEGTDVAKALSDRAMSVTTRPVGPFPSTDELAATDAVVLVDVDAGAIGDLQAALLDRFVSDLGGGLVTVGGESSFSLGGYRESALEALLPLSSDIKDPQRRPSIAQVLAVDTSGSMGQCHCAGPEMQSDRLAQGPNKTTISREAAAKAIDALNQDDEVGVLAFNTSSRWVIPLQKLPSSEVVRSGLQKMHPTGGTSIPQAIDKAVAELKGSKASLKHVILFTDGWTNQAGLSEAAAKVKAEGITLSVVATGEGTGKELQKMAEAGGGRFYPGRNLDQIPEIFMNEVIVAARRYVNEGEFFPKVVGSSAATDRLVESPALLGYVATTAKPSTSVKMSIGSFDDPLLASWRKGTGVVTSWTSDAKARWASRWVSWEGFADFWSDVVKETLPAGTSAGFALQVRSSSDRIEVEVSSQDPIPEGAVAKARLVKPDGTVTLLEMERKDARVFIAAAPISDAGTYLVSAEVATGDNVLFRDTAGAAVAYPAEYLPGTRDTQLLSSISSVSGGRSAIDPSMSFDAVAGRGSNHRELTSLLTIVAIVLFPVDIAARRLIMTRSDLRSFFRRRHREEPEVADASERLLRAKRERTGSG